LLIDTYYMLSVFCKKRLYLTVFLFFSLGLQASDENHQAFLKRAAAIDKELQSHASTLLGIIVQSEAMFQKYADDEFAKNLLSQFTSTYYSQAGEHSKVLSIADVGSEPYAADSGVHTFTNYQSALAVDVLVNMANETQVVMLNEAHHIAQHRVLTYQLLARLWVNGYRYLALEALSFDENAFAGTLRKVDGYYTEEPVFAYTIRQALRLGFQLISYDIGGQSISEREVAAANSLKQKIFDKDPKAKVIIHVGYAHIDESGWLAAELNHLLGINPLTIDQVKYAEKSERQFENPNYQSVLDQFPNEQPFVLVGEDKEIYSSQPNRWDITVVWPRTKYTLNKPNWMILDRMLHKVDAELCEGYFPCMIEVYESELADKKDVFKFVPIDRTVLFNDKEKKAVLMESGKGLLIVTNIDGELIARRLLSI
jgi:VanZ family protein